jgi:acyl dehydratase
MSDPSLSCPAPSPPPLPKLGVATLLRALFKRPVPASGTTPGATYRLERIDREHVRRYNAAFGFAGDAVPLTFLYLLAQRAQLATLIARPIPFRIPGLVHVQNRLEMHAGIDAESPLALTTRVAIPPPSASGAVLCVLETRAFAGDQRAFTCISTYLVKRGSGGKGRNSAQAESIGADEIGGWRLTPDAGRLYAALSGDWNPIHLWRWSARLMGMRAPIIHGMHSVAQACALIERLTQQRMTRLDCRFKSPIPLGADVKLARGAEQDKFVVLCNGRVAVDAAIDMP